MFSRTNLGWFSDSTTPPRTVQPSRAGVTAASRQLHVPSTGGVFAHLCLVHLRLQVAHTCTHASSLTKEELLALQLRTNDLRTNDESGLDAEAAGHEGSKCSVT